MELSDGHIMTHLIVVSSWTAKNSPIRRGYGSWLGKSPLR